MTKRFSFNQSALPLSISVPGIDRLYSSYAQAEEENLFSIATISMQSSSEGIPHPLEGKNLFVVANPHFETTEDGTHNLVVTHQSHQIAKFTLDSTSKIELGEDRISLFAYLTSISFYDPRDNPFNSFSHEPKSESVPPPHQVNVQGMPLPVPVRVRLNYLRTKSEQFDAIRLLDYTMHQERSLSKEYSTELILGGPDA